MADEKQVEILKQGVHAWNEWRDRNSGVQVDLRHADLGGADLGATNLHDANLADAILADANLTYARLYGADLSRAYLVGANLYGAKLDGANLTYASMGWTILGELDLRGVIGLAMVNHSGPSTIGIDTIYNSQGNIPDTFLRGAGVPENLIAYIESLISQVIEFYSCFISYSSKDERFAERLYADLQTKGVRCWYAPEDLKPGDKFRARIDEAIRKHEKLLLILSKNAIESDWVQTEVEKALHLEQQRKAANVLFPVRIDNSVLRSEAAWACDIKLSRHIGDFTGWKDHDAYMKAFARLLRDLNSSEAVKP
jgi:hypothetical protein